MKRKIGIGKFEVMAFVLHCSKKQEENCWAFLRKVLQILLNYALYCLESTE